MRKLFIPLIALVTLLSQSSCSDEIRASLISASPSDSLPRFATPIGCTLGEDCFVLLYTDRDPGPSETDFGCGRMTYNKHTGTDFAIPDEQAMAKGVNVLAAADGTVLRVRDGESDRKFNNTEEDKRRIDGKDCGNGLVIDHGQGWETQYCHLRQNSVKVKPGTVVKAGTVLGLVGQSGQASFPHVHFEPRYQGKPVDPFLGPDAKTGCNVPAKSMWQQNLTYIPTGIMNAGFTDQEPKLETAEQGKINHAKLSANSPMLLAWVRSYGVLKGDVESLRIIAPDGSIFSDLQRTLEQSKRIWFIYAGKHKPDTLFMTGKWRSEYKLTRGNKTVINTSREVNVE